MRSYWSGRDLMLCQETHQEKKPYSFSYVSGSFYPRIEGEDWYPIDVDAGSSDKPLDLDYWTYLKNHEGDWTEAEESRATESATKAAEHKFSCCRCLKTLYMPVLIRTWWWEGMRTMFGQKSS
ncbi:hypothetical protein B0H14DRAFT_2570493 [Mycena olivaceomarginata]|nr:hypothetical protein B0H14DRAFT_2570493 [Mycena olivaceomarginata]